MREVKISKPCAVLSGPLVSQLIHSASCDVGWTTSLRQYGMAASTQASLHFTSKSAQSGNCIYANSTSLKNYSEIMPEVSV